MRGPPLYNVFALVWRRLFFYLDCCARVDQVCNGIVVIQSHLPIACKLNLHNSACFPPCFVGLFDHFRRIPLATLLASSVGYLDTFFWVGAVNEIEFHIAGVSNAVACRLVWWWWWWNIFPCGSCWFGFSRWGCHLISWCMCSSLQASCFASGCTSSQMLMR